MAIVTGEYTELCLWNISKGAHARGVMCINDADDLREIVLCANHAFQCSKIHSMQTSSSTLFHDFASKNGLFITSSQRPRLNPPMSARQIVSATIKGRKCSGDEITSP